MGFIERVAVQRTKAAPFSGSSVSATISSIGTEGPPRPDILRNHVRSNSFVNACVVLRKAQASSADWKILPKNPKAKMTAPLNRAIVAATSLLESPNPDGRNTSFSGLIEPVIDDILTLGYGAIIPVRNLGGEIVSLHYVDAARVRFLPNWNSNDDGPRYLLLNQGERDKGKKLMNNELITIVLNPTTYNETGYSPVMVLHDKLEAAYDSFRSNWMVQKNRAPAGLVDLEGMPEQELRKLERLFQTTIEGNSTVGWINHPIDNIKFVELGSIDLEKQGAVWFTDFLIRNICAAFQVSPVNIQWTQDVNRACYSSDTETLTENGWKYYWEIGKSDRIATFNPEIGALEYCAPDGLYLYQYKGEMIHFESKNVDALVTPDHKMWVRTQQKSRTSKTYEKLEASQLENMSRFTFSVSSGFHGQAVEQFVLPGAERVKFGRSDLVKPDRTIPMDLWLEFLGYVISEGCVFKSPKSGTYRINLCQKKEPQRAKIQQCLDRLPFAFKARVGNDGTTMWQVNDKALWIWLRDNIGTRSCTKKLPSFVVNLSTDQLQILFLALMDGDGTFDRRTNRTSGSYSTNSEQLANDFQHLAIKLGYRTQLCPGKRSIRVLLNCGSEVGLSKENVHRDQYDDTVYCFEVPNHLFFTRRNGKVLIAGNTAREQLRLTGDQGIVPLMKTIAAIINREVIQTLEGAQDIEFVWSELLVKDEAQSADTLRKRAGNYINWAPVNVLALADGMDPSHTDTNDPLYPWFNEPLIQVNSGQFAPISVAAKLPQYQSAEDVLAAKVAQAEANKHGAEGALNETTQEQNQANTDDQRTDRRTQQEDNPSTSTEN